MDLGVVTRILGVKFVPLVRASSVIPAFALFTEEPSSTDKGIRLFFIVP